MRLQFVCADPDSRAEILLPLYGAFGLLLAGFEQLFALQLHVHIAAALEPHDLVRVRNTRGHFGVG